MLKAHAYSILTDPDLPGGRLEKDWHRCEHCGRMIALNPGQPPYATCRACMEPICERCYGLLMRGAVCKTIEQQMDELERAVAKQRAVEAWF